MTVYVYNTIPDKGSSTMSFSICLRKFWIITIIIYQAFLSTAALPNPPVKLTASEITPSSLKLSWKPGNQDDISYIVQYKAKQHPGDFHEIRSIKKTEYTIEKMEAYQQYELRAIAVTKSGRSSPSASLEVITGELAPSSAPRNVRARPQDMKTIRIDWDEPEIPNGIIQGYKIFYTTNPDLPVVLWMNQEVAGENKVTTISDLIPNSTYTICVLAYSSMGQGPLSVPVLVMTRQEENYPVPLQPRNLRARPISPNEMEITWDAPEDIDQVVDYTLYYNDSQKHTNNQVRVLPPTTKYILTELVPDTIYHIQLAARSSRGLGVRTILVQAKTPEFIPNEPRRVQMQAVNSTTIYVKWQPPRAMDRNGMIRGYYVYYSQVDQNNNVIKGTEKIEDVNDGNKNEAMITGLLPDTRYQVTVAGYTRRGDGVRSRPLIINTKGAVRRVPPNFASPPPDVIEVDPNARLTIDCTAVGSPMPVVRWQKGYSEINPKDDPPLGRNVLKLTGVRESTNYTCVAQSELGNIETVVQVRVKAPGSAPRNVRARPQDMQTLRIDWNEPEIPNGIIQGYKIFYTTNPNLPVVLWMIQEVAGENKMTIISGLIPNSTYTICVLAYSSTGQGPLSVPVRVMMRQEVRVPLQPRNLRARPISPNEIEITWDAPEDIDQVVDYTLYYNDSQKHTNNQVRVLPPTTKYILTDLVPDTIYHIQLAARSSRGLGVRSLLVQAKTPEFIPNEPERVQVQAVNSTTIYVEWRPPRPMDRKGTIRGYYVYYAKVDQNNNVIMSTEKIEDVNDGNKNEAVITGLLPNTRYQVTVAGYTRRGDGVRSRPKIINTMEAVDETDKEFSVDEVTVKLPSTSDNCVGKSSNQSELSAGGNAEGELQEPKSSQSQSKAKTLKELKMEYYQQAIAGLKVQTECFAKVSKLADVLIAKFSST